MLWEPIATLSFLPISCMLGPSSLLWVTAGQLPELLFHSLILYASCPSSLPPPSCLNVH